MERVDATLSCQVNEYLAVGKDVPGFAIYQVPRFEAWDPVEQHSKGDHTFTGHNFDEQGAFDFDVADEDFLASSKFARTLGMVWLERLATNCVSLDSSVLSR